MADKLKILVAVIIAAGALVAFYYFDDQSTLIRVIGLLVALIFITVIMLQTAVGKGTWVFIQEAQTEVKKVVWPTRKETLQTTGLVMVMAILIAIFLWLLDSALIWAVKMLTGQGA